jgi:hypothetical protein
MRPTTNSERYLLCALGLVFVGGAIFFGDKALNRREQALELQRSSLQAARVAGEVELQQMPLWTKRAQWIRDHEPVMGDEGDMRAQLLAFAVKGARDHHLEVLDQSVGDVQHGPGGAKVEAELKLKGGMESLCRWLAELQKPTSFYAVDSFSLKADNDQKSMVCSLRIARYFRDHGS